MVLALLALAGLPTVPAVAAAQGAGADSLVAEPEAIGDPDLAVELRAALPDDAWAADGAEQRLLGLLPEGEAGGAGPDSARAAAGPSRGRGGPRSGASHGRLTVYSSAAAGGAGPVTCRAEWKSKAFNLLLRARRAPDGAVTVAGGTALSGGSWALAVGNLEMDQGLGLLSASAGRWRSLSAAVPLSRFGRGWSLAGTAEGSRALAGAVVQGPAAGGVIQILSGVPGSLGQADLHGRPAALCARWTRDGPRGALAVLGGRWGDSRGLSAGVAWLTGGWSGTAELALWRPRLQAPIAGAAAAGLAWARPHGWRLDAQAAAGWAEAAAPFAAGPAVLSGADGHGWALRGAGPLGRGVLARALVAESEATSLSTATGAPGRERSGRREIGLVWRLAGGWGAEVRWSARAERETGWVERSPWLPPAVADWERRSQAALTVSGARGAWRWRVTARSLSRADAGATASAAASAGQGVADGAAAPGLRRTLLSGLAERGRRRGLLVRGAWGLAWGDPVDLVTVASPWPGLSMPRHWGAWADEASLGIGWRAARWEWGIGLARCRPDPPGSAAQSVLSHRFGWRW